ncbi:hypothetical protein FOMPIDRAFT_1098981, partial [Fomitopsis schrenkii]
MLLPPATPTLEAANSKIHTRPDNIFASQELAGLLIRCRTAPELCPPGTDHYLVVTELQVNVPHVVPNTFWNFRKTDWPSFRKSLAIQLVEDVPYPDGDIPSTNVFNNLLTQLLQALHDTINEAVPETRPPPFAKRWFSKESDDMHREVSQLGRAAFNLRDIPCHPVHKEYRTLHNRY